MIVVADSAPLIALAKIGQFQLLRSVYGSLGVPKAVNREVVSLGISRPGAAEVNEANWIQVFTVRDQTAVALLRQQLDLGESEAITLAIQLGATSLLIDEAKGRRIAQSQGIPVIGTIGTLLLAKQRSLIGEVTPLLNELQMSGFHMSSGLYLTAQKLAGELP